MDKNYYKILGINEGATVEEIRNAYRKKVKEYHPDINKDSNSVSIIQDINLAYEKIMEIKKKRFEEAMSHTHSTSDSVFDEYKISGIDFDIASLNPDCIFVGDIYVVKYKINYDYFATFEEQTYLKLKSKNAILLRIGFERYINLSKIKNSFDAKRIKNKLKNSIEKEKVTILGEFFKPYAGNQVALNVKPYSVLKKNEQTKKNSKKFKPIMIKN